MKKIVNILRVALVAVLCMALSLLTVACAGGSSGDAPTYKGMYISSTKPSAPQTTSFVASYRDAGVNGDLWDGKGNLNQNKPFGNNGNHYGHGKNNPDDVPTIEEEISTSLQVTGPAADLYYANKSQDLYVTVKLENPDEFEIESFTLNGTKYASYMFEQGSDLENLILKITVPATASGIVDYTLDSIKYIDGTDIKDVALNTDKTVKVGVYNEIQPTVAVSNESTGFYNVAFTANVTDAEGEIARSQGSVKAVLYDGDTLVQTKDLVVGSNNVNFENLKINSIYQYAVVAIYDDFSGEGQKAHVLNKKAVATKTALAFDNIGINTDGADFTFEWDEEWSTKTVKTLALYQAGQKIVDLETDATVVKDLLSETEYQIIATYDNKGADENIYLNFKTSKFSYYASKYKLSGEIKIVSITCADFINMFDTTGNFLVYIDSEDAGAQTRFTKINKIAKDWGVTIYHFNPNLSGGYADNNLNAQTTTSSNH